MYCWGTGLSNPYFARQVATMVGSLMALCPKLRAAGSPGTNCVTENEIKVIPIINKIPTAILRMMKVPGKCRRTPSTFADGVRAEVTSFKKLTDSYLSSVRFTFQIGFDAIPITVGVETKVAGD